MSFITSVSAWHERKFENPWFTHKITTAVILISLIFGTIACYMNFQARYINWEIWKQNKVEFFAGDTPLFTTMDAGYFLGIAGYLKSGKTFEEYQFLHVRN